MTRDELKGLEKGLEEFTEQLTAGMGRAERREAMRLYMSGLLLEGERKSIQPMAARLTSRQAEVEGMRQRLQQAVVVANWSEAEVYKRLSAQAHQRLSGLEAYILDDTGFAKKGDKSVGVTRQYSGTLGRVDNCQVATSLHLAGEKHSLCIGQRLFLPEAWAEDSARRSEAGVPEAVVFQKKWQQGIALLDSALASGSPKHTLLADAGYGDSTEFREEVEARGLKYVVGISSVPTVWPPGVTPRIQHPTNRGRPATRATAESHPVSVAALADSLPAKQFKKISWRAGSKGSMKGTFCAVRVYSAEKRTKKNRPTLQPIWLLIEKTQEAKRPFKFSVSNLPADTSLRELVRTAKLRWRIERDYQEMKSELGLDHFEGRTWRGFHHHAALVAAAHAFLVFQRSLFPPKDSLDAA